MVPPMTLLNPTDVLFLHRFFKPFTMCTWFFLLAIPVFTYWYGNFSILVQLIQIIAPKMTYATSNLKRTLS